ncbi:flagellar hook-basal body complex protein FliE [Candidatus Contubernalis alkaliaceticus]|uniref:flagellar hook-basal body complex protein FliE n=1 Tax=Candidatus Contubernalis alkaliaceticus TaxID=338645 RepID=UPI001F4BE61C|nr:flagellar hook-basal body complex protein FliE [Candidatus Contubernalis alkalaceticus]UNC91742.1 flagellar hook-basal body complex protein FliE [Candidatus Contubernalis alkalaceticus]
MRINPINLLMPEPAARIQKNDQVENAKSFGQVLQQALQDVNSLQVQADDLTARMVLGEVEDVHEVMLASEQAKMALQLTVQIRNKLIEAYQEVSRMQF